MDSLRDWIAEHPPPDSRFTQTVAGVAERVRDGEDLRFAVRELRAAALADEPAHVDSHVDAYLGALAEHLARVHDLPIPTWALADDRMLDHMWFPGVAPGFRPTALRESPVAFRRRGIFIARGALSRV
jgi:hypothetical protein